MLAVRNVSKVFGAEADRYVALNGIDLSVSEGEFVCLLGPSGCGKSTLLNILAGFEQASGGTVEFDGAPVRGAGKDRMMFFQDAGSALLPWYSAEENVRFALRVRKMPKEEWPAIIDKYLAMVDLKDHRHKFPAQLSGGMRQRLQIARALAVEPKVLLMDEPFGALDVQTRDLLQDELLAIWQRERKTVLFVTHSIEEAIFLADRVVVMEPGPGRIASEHRIDLPRGRDVSSPEFNDVRRMLGARLHSHHAPKAA